MTFTFSFIVLSYAGVASGVGVGAVVDDKSNNTVIVDCYAVMFTIDFKWFAILQPI